MPLVQNRKQVQVNLKRQCPGSRLMGWQIHFFQSVPSFLAEIDMRIPLSTALDTASLLRNALADTKPAGRAKAHIQHIRPKNDGIVNRLNIYIAPCCLHVGITSGRPLKQAAGLQEQLL